MAAKYQLITELYRRTGITVAKNPQAWQSFLAAACRNYKCRFDEQLLIYAQRPDAIAVAELDTWNKRFKRWVNKDSKGIAVFDPKGRRNTLKYYFDVSDTHDGYYGSRPVPIWQMNGRYEQAVIERLSDRFGNTESTDLASALTETAKNAVEDNLQDYFSQLKGFTRDSFLEELDDLMQKQRIRRNKVVTPMKTPLRNMLPTGFPTELTVSRTRVSTNLTSKGKRLSRKQGKISVRQRIKYRPINRKRRQKPPNRITTACRSVTGLQAVPLLPIAPKGQNLSLSRPDSKAKRRLRPPPEMLKRRSRQPQKVRSKPPRKALRLHRLPLRRLSKQPSIPPKQRRQRQRLRQKRLKGLHRQQKPLPRLRLRR